MALYVDTSCLLKVFFPEPETMATVALIAREHQVVRGRSSTTGMSRRVLD